MCGRGAAQLLVVCFEAGILTSSVFPGPGWPVPAGRPSQKPRKSSRPRRIAVLAVIIDLIVEFF
jgi:hypothetical protein